MSFSTKVAAPPPAPAPVNAGESASEFVRQMASPDLQNLLLSAESTYRPQYTALTQRDLQNTLLGVAPGTSEGYYGTLDLADMAARRQAALSQSLQSQAGEYAIAQLGSLGPQARNAYLAANPGLAAVVSQAEALGGRQMSGYLNAAGQLAMRPLGEQNITPATVTAPGAYTPKNVAADQVQLGGVLTPERIAAQQVAAGQVQAGSVGGGELGQSLYQQALQAQQLSPLSQALQAQGLGMAQQPGQLTPQEIRAATQGSREGFAATGRLGDNASIAAEALARAGAARERTYQDLAAAQGINAQLLGAQQQGQALATDVLRTDIGRQQFNVGTGLQAGQFNVGTALDAARANQAAALQAAQANQQYNFAGQQFNITNAQEVQRMNQMANLQAALANQGAGMQAYQFGAGQNLAAQELNARLGLGAQESNRAFGAQQQQQQFANLLGMTGMEQQMLVADRGYASQLAGLQSGITGQSLGLIGFGQAPSAMGYGVQQQGISQGQVGVTPQLFDPNAGINLALMNQANLGNYQSATYGARAAAQGQIAGGMLGAIGNIGGSLLGNPRLFGGG